MMRTTTCPKLRFLRALCVLRGDTKPAKTTKRTKNCVQASDRIRPARSCRWLHLTGDRGNEASTEQGRLEAHRLERAAAWRYRRIGIDIEPEYYRMAARFLKKESSNLFINAELIFEKMVADRSGQVGIREDQALYQVRSARKALA